MFGAGLVFTGLAFYFKTEYGYAAAKYCLRLFVFYNT